ncbi:MAG: translocation/assembly module TamB domain-containing protein [Bacteroidales bacterium]|nr:translocation/assembly module TamB domain-containing protein [Bacteroidales bacterium]
MQNRQVQTVVSKMLAEQLSEELHSTISLSSVNFSFFKRIQVRDLYIEDLHGDTLIYSELTKIRIKQIRPDQRRLEISKITLENAWLNLVIESEGGVNLSLIIDRLKKPHVPPERKSKLHIHEITMSNGRFSLTKTGHQSLRPEIDFNDFDLHGLEISLLDLISDQDTVNMNIVSLSAVEKSGFEFGHLATRMSVGKTHMHFKDLAIMAGGSELNVPVLGFDFDHWQGFKYFSREVDLTFESDHSQVKTEDLAVFVPQTAGILDRFTIDGSLHGALSKLKGEKMEMTFDEQSTLAFDFIAIGLPDFSNTFLDFNFRELNSSVSAIHTIFNQKKAASKQSLYPWINMGMLDFKGQFTGYPDNFVAMGYLQTDMGQMLMDLSFRPDSILGIDFHGHLSTRDYKLGELLGQEELLSQLDMDVMVDGNLFEGEIRANLNGTIDTLYFSQYAYSNITLDGAFTNNTFNGGFSISDPNIRMDFQGKTDFSGEVPFYNFTADVARSRPYFLNLGVEDPHTFASFLIETDISGNTLDELNGEIRLVNSLFERNQDQVQLYDVRLHALNRPDTSSIELRSELIDASISGKFKLSSLPSSLENMVDHYVNLIPGKPAISDTINRFTYHLDLKHVNPVLDFFFPKIQIAENSSIHGEYHPDRGINSAEGHFPELGIGPGSWSNAEYHTRTFDDKFEFMFRADSMIYGKNYALENQQFHLTASNDTARLDIDWSNHSEPDYSGEIHLFGSFLSDSMAERGFLVEVEPSEFFIQSEKWNVDHSTFLLRKNYLHVDNLFIRSREKHVLAAGTIASGGGQDFDLDIRNLNLGELASLGRLNAELNGNITGNFNYRETEGNPYIYTDLQVDTLRFNNQLLGPTSLKAAWNDTRRTVRVMLQSNLNDVKTIELNGEYIPEGRKVDFEIHVNELQLQALHPYVENFLVDLSGTGSVNLTLDGTLDQPKLNGSLGFNQGAATISLLNTPYLFNGPVRIYNNNLYFENFTASDQEGNVGRINGSISNNYFRDFYANIHMEAENLNFMDTRSLDNDLFYGTVFATGDATVQGSFNDLKLTVDASTEKNTALYLPLYNAREVQRSDFITFIQETEHTEREAGRQESLRGIEIELEVEITEDAVVQLIFDPKVGDIIEASGRGNIRMLVDQYQGFRMFGDVELLSGDYLFTLQNVINKRFQIEPGGMINFNGSPTNASIDLAAIYGTRVAPYNLYQGDPSDDYAELLKKRIPVECHLQLLGDLRSPTIAAGIEMPTADPETRGILDNATSTEDELMKQFISLLVINDFYSVAGYGIQNMGTMNSSIAGVTASELLSNQLSNWLSQISDDFDIGFNYRPGDQVSTQEMEVALSTQLLNDRVIISGNLDVGGQETNPSSEASNNPYIMGDFEVEYRVTDNVSILAFNRSRDELIAMTAPYKQGVGVSYREDFNNLSQLLARYKEAISNRKKKKKKSGKSDSQE